MENIEVKTGTTPDKFWKLAIKEGLVKDGKVVAQHAEMLKWLKTEMGLGHVHANFMILHLCLRSKDTGVSVGIREWTYSMGYKEWEPRYNLAKSTHVEL
jgi:hypothetical protein